MTKKWKILHEETDDIVETLLSNRGCQIPQEKEAFLHPKHPGELTAKDVGIDFPALQKATARIKKAIHNKEQIVVYADYDADGICAGAIMWETIHAMGGNVMPYIPHRVEEGYGLSVKGIEAVRKQYDPSLIITVDHGITARTNVAYATSLHIDVVVTDHHVKPEKLPDCPIVHTTQLSGAGVAWFVANTISGAVRKELLTYAAIGTIADLVPLTGANRPVVKHGLEELNKTTRVGLIALMQDAGLMRGDISPYDVSHILAPRLNAMGRLDHAMDSLRLLCTRQKDKAVVLAQKLGLTNKERQKLTLDTSLHAKDSIIRQYREGLPKLLFVSHQTYSPGVIGLVAGKLVEEYYHPAIVVSVGETVSKASARSVVGFNIVETIKHFDDLLVDMGGHPMAAGFTVETKNIDILKSRMEAYVQNHLSDELLTRELRIDMELPLSQVTETLWRKLCRFEPFGFGSPEPVFATRGVTVSDFRLVGADGKHLKMKISSLDAIGFGMGSIAPMLKIGKRVDIAYTVDMNTWNGNKKLQVKLKDMIIFA